MVAAIVGQSSFASLTYSASPQADSFAAGTVVVQSSAGGSPTCSIANIAPGQSGTCTYNITYNGTLNGWVGLDVNASSVAAAVYQAPAGTVGGEALLPNQESGDPLEVQTGNASVTAAVYGLQVSLTDSLGDPLVFPAVTCPNADSTAAGSAEGTSAAPCTGSADGQFLKTIYVCAGDAVTCNNAPTGSWAQGASDTVTLTWALPLDTPGTYYGSSASITLQALAVQASNDPLGGCGLPSVGWVGAGTSSSPCSPPPGPTTSVVTGFTQGYWQSPPGTTELVGSSTWTNSTDIKIPTPIGSGSRQFTVTTVGQSQTILPGSFDACSLFGCGSSFSSGLGSSDVDHLSSQTLALAYSIGYVGGYSGETLGQLNSVLSCSTNDSGYASDLSTLGLNAGSTVNAILTTADGLIGGSMGGGSTTSAQVAAMTDLLGNCVNLEGKA